VAQAAFKNVIKAEGRCADTGSNQYLVNTDTQARYRVTVRTTSKFGLRGPVASDEVYISEAGEKQLIGCTRCGNWPYVNCTRQVVGESRIDR